MFNVLTINDVQKELGQLVILLRKKNGLTQQHLADELKLSRITIQNLEAGKNSTLDTTLKVLKYFDYLNDFSLFIQSIENKNNQIPNFY